MKINYSKAKKAEIGPFEFRFEIAELLEKVAKKG
jgi:hypothetical protein